MIKEAAYGYSQAASRSPTPATGFASAPLAAGQMYDLLHQRPDAIRMYQQVLNPRRRPDSGRRRPQVPGHSLQRQVASAPATGVILSLNEFTEGPLIELQRSSGHRRA
jgi:hypothetical protein